MTPKIAFPLLAGVLFLLILLSMSPSQEILTQPPPIETMADLDALFAQEPSYGQIQQVAMRFAEVHPDKIAAWRRGASLRAFLPKVIFRYDFSRQYEYATSRRIDNTLSEKWSVDVGQSYSTGQDHYNYHGDQWSVGGIGWTEEEKWSTQVQEVYSTRTAYGKDTGQETTSGFFDKYAPWKEWGFRMEWDLRDFLYNRDQTRISKEARDLVELRQDILEEVNTYFFDRRRAQIELLFSPPLDPRSKIDLQLRIARLTANIDALTGGYLSKQLEKVRTIR